MPAGRRRRERYWVHSAPDTAQDTGTRECARGPWCRDRTVTISNGQRVTIPAEASPGEPFCIADQWDIADQLTDLADTYPWLILERLLPAPPDNTGRHTAAIAPPIPIRLDVDALMRRITAILCAWEDRVRADPRLHLTRADPDRWRGYDTPAAATTAATTLSTHLATLLALPHAPMTHPGVTTDPHWAPEWSGADAGLLILRLRYQTRAVLGLVARKPELLLGVACYQCNLRTLHRAAPPQNDRDPLWYSECGNCRHRMTEPEYRDHVSRLAALHGGPRRNRP